ncbi:MAG: GIY-YIG nuclease family protein [Elusimicrobia bacterium]|nr:GIY-YIG nuclease family protein [Elusimicrobiota bacterium]
MAEFNSGVYSIRGPNGRLYIGSASSFTKRWKRHRWALVRGSHHSRFLQRAWDKYGESCFSFQILIICSVVDAFYYEQMLIDAYKPAYNVSPSASGTRGLIWTEESRSKIRGRTNSSATRAAISRGMLTSSTHEERSERAARARAGWTPESKASQIQKLTGRKDSDETRAKKSASLTGRLVSEETRQKLAKQAGWVHSDESKQKMRGRVVSTETRLLLSQSHVDKPGPWKGLTRTLETKDKIRASLAGRSRSPESIAKHRATLAAKRKLKLNSADFEVSQ